MEKQLGYVDHQIATFNSLTLEFDPWYQYTDDQMVYIKHAMILNQMLHIKHDLGLFGQALSIPVGDPATGRLIGH